MFLESVSRDESQGPTPQLLASLQSLGENSDYTLLPHSLHQVCVCVWWFESTCEEYFPLASRGNSQCLYLVCVRECAYIHSTSLGVSWLHSLCEWRRTQQISEPAFGECVSVARYIYKWRANESCGCVYCLKGQLFESVLQRRCRIWTGSPPTPRLCSAHMLIRSPMDTVRFQPCVRFKRITAGSSCSTFPVTVP